ncbi:LysR family transcriptional regulator [Colwellia psychrerythraea]|uniref:Transcriptional regulator, LysR family n=1 Tax=Colwellia psychrerythraea TaxID=28229 RepID=A0A099KM02_COLPS|nr:LysR family transcriptional regulator [Colwellia psychrerythraea]KGJ90967.1 transcriptional regulator, LysR family [Colwellia psychrerythraea]
MRIRHIEVFNAIYSLGSVSAAARYLHITQPTASKVLKNAEHYLGYQLFIRVDGKLIATPEAEILYKKTAEINKQLIELKLLSENLKNTGTGKIRIAAIPAIGIEFLPRAMQAYQLQHPNVKFEIQLYQSQDVVKALFSHDKDIGILFEGESYPGTTQTHLTQGQCVCVCAPDTLTDKNTVSMAEIAEQNIISMENSGPLEHIFHREFTRESLTKNSANITAQTYLVAKNLAALGTGVAVMDEFSARTTSYGDIAIKPVVPALHYQVIAMTLEQTSLSVDAERFVLFLTEFLSAEAIAGKN